MKSIPTIPRKRLSLRPFTGGDVDDIQRLAGEAAIADTTMNIPHPYTVGMAREWISRHAPSFETGEGVTWAVTLKEDRRLVGAISLMGIKEDHQAELGYWIGKPYWNRGYCSEAGGAVLEYAFTELGLVRVHASHLSRNPASGRVMQKLGMTPEGVRKQHAAKGTRLEDLTLYGILKQDWASQRTIPGSSPATPAMCDSSSVGSPLRGRPTTEPREVLCGYSAAREITMQPVIREAIAADLDVVWGFVKKKAAYDQWLDRLEATPQKLGEAMFSTRPLMGALLAETGSGVVGFATYFFTFSTYLARRCVWLDDLYVDAESRGSGIGKKLLQGVAMVAIKQGCPRVEWVTAATNAKAIQFYERMGAQVRHQSRVCRLNKEAIVTVAEARG